MNAKFSLGDRVRIVKWMWPYSPAKLWVGKLGTIRHVHSANGSQKYDVLLDVPGTTHTLDERELERAKQRSSFWPQRQKRNLPAKSNS